VARPAPGLTVLARLRLAVRGAAVTVAGGGPASLRRRRASSMGGEAVDWLLRSGRWTERRRLADGCQFVVPTLPGLRSGVGFGSL
jgi:hypothetical protein